ncbi:uncharacterized protein MONBRDRAFT_32027 [Monosiga brevicollis MX1]|uniref:Uncharacterized protein n=1 Tax=Monosiga brevicollis TaxID=81824 RepID=A9UWY2_MONBE|nr:uncharacterized protein MONBRDRAFT_32027 [Monosiga brevicollis MX1]EDQ90296.1 predicted protein [Monosiga brevicollis MX1]|eukprot:XP_001745063.1 hypothetical protein [Monosiga brevicollis MX1]
MAQQEGSSAMGWEVAAAGDGAALDPSASPGPPQLESELQHLAQSQLEVEALERQMAELADQELIVQQELHLLEHLQPEQDERTHLLLDQDMGVLGGDVSTEDFELRRAKRRTLLSQLEERRAELERDRQNLQRQKHHLLARNELRPTASARFPATVDSIQSFQKQLARDQQRLQARREQARRDQLLRLAPTNRLTKGREQYDRWQRPIYDRCRQIVLDIINQVLETHALRTLPWDVPIDDEYASLLAHAQAHRQAWDIYKAVVAEVVEAEIHSIWHELNAVSDLAAKLTNHLILSSVSTASTDDRQLSTALLTSTLHAMQRGRTLDKYIHHTQALRRMHKAAPPDSSPPRRRRSSTHSRVAQELGFQELDLDTTLGALALPTDASTFIPPTHVCTELLTRDQESALKPALCVPRQSLVINQGALRQAQSGSRARAILCQFYPALTLTGLQPSLLVGFDDGDIWRVVLQPDAKLVDLTFERPDQDSTVLGDNLMSGKFPVEVFRGHSGDLLVLDVSHKSKKCFSLDSQGVLLVWMRGPEHLTGFGWYEPAQRYRFQFSRKVLRLREASSQLVYDARNTGTLFRRRSKRLEGEHVQLLAACAQQDALIDHMMGAEHHKAYALPDSQHAEDGIVIVQIVGIGGAEVSQVHRAVADPALQEATAVLGACTSHWAGDLFVAALFEAEALCMPTLLFYRLQLPGMEVAPLAFRLPLSAEQAARLLAAKGPDRRQMLRLWCTPTTASSSTDYLCLQLESELFIFDLHRGVLVGLPEASRKEARVTPHLVADGTATDLWLLRAAAKQKWFLSTLHAAGGMANAAPLQSASARWHSGGLCRAERDIRRQQAKQIASEIINASSSANDKSQNAESFSIHLSNDKG